MDSRSNYAEPPSPDIRYRIRLNPYTATVDEGALFDMEVGPEGITFHLALRYRGTNLPHELAGVLHLWKDGVAWLGGSGSTGKGRFILEGMEIFEWNLRAGLNSYIGEQGRRGREREIGKKPYPAGLTPVDLPDKNTLSSYQEYLKPQWMGITYKITISSPLISADTIHALLDEKNRDAIMFEKRVICGNTGDVETVPAIKGETFRGIIRTAVGKRSGGLDIDNHEDCSCHLCVIFGNEHEAGKIRFEDLTPVPFDPVQWQDGQQTVGENGCSPVQSAPPAGSKMHIKYKHIDHVAIDRFHGGAEDAMKFDTYSLAGSPKDPITLKGRLWIKNDLSADYRKNIATALADVRYGLYPIGGKTGVGYGWVSGFKIIEAPAEFKQLLIVEAPDAFKQPITGKQEPQPEDRNYPGLPKLKLKPGDIHYPHYFLKPANTVKRERKMIGHEKFHDTYTFDDGTKEKLVSGKITCKLTTNSPLIIPDTGDEKDLDNNTNSAPPSAEIMNAGKTTTVGAHKSYKFFRIHGDIMIPGSEIRGMVSSVYEAITNSCFRIFDEKDRLSWRMEAKGLSKKLKKGRITKAGNGTDFVVEIYKKSARVPFYDGHVNPFEQLNDNQIKGMELTILWVKEWLTKLKVSLRKPGNFDNWKELEGTFYKNNEDGYRIQFSLKNQPYGVHQNVSKFERDVYSKYPDNSFIKFWFKEEKIPYFMASLVEPDNTTGWTKKTGYLKVTGPNKVEVEDLQEGKLPHEVHDGMPEDWRQIRVNGQKKEKDGTVTKVFRCSFNGKLYTMSKWCETFFYEKDGNKTVTKEATLQYQRLIEKYQKNPQASPEVFQSLPTKRINEYLKNGDLVYVILDERTDVAKEIIPVQISRHIDEESLGFKMPDDNLRPCCGREVLEEGLLKDINDNLSLLPQLNKLFSIHPEGLCPACRLFGTTYYKGRVRFGFAHLSSEPKWLIPGENGAGGPLTLPLLERPRPTWSIPSDEYEVPGRKFYVHHNGWQAVQKNNDRTKGTENNRTVEPLDAGNEFTFDLYFENLREWELGLLLYSLELEPGMAHKLGMGKPLGFGGVEVEVKRLLAFNPETPSTPPATDSPVQNQREANRHTSGAEWKSLENRIEEFVEKGLEKLKEWFGKEWDTIQHIQDVRRLLLQSPTNEANVKYPRLNEKTEGDGGEPGYTYENLADKEKVSYHKRREMITNPWSSWNIFKKKRGVVKFFHKDKGFGFIIVDDGSEAFVYKTSIKGTVPLAEKLHVQFETREGRKGPEAFDVEII